MDKRKCEIGMIGLGTMGRNLLLNFADQGFVVAGYDRDTEKVELLRRQTEQRWIYAAKNIEELVDALRKPRAVMILVPAGAPVDAVIESLSPLLEAGDVVVDGGNSHFTDTNRRAATLEQEGIHLLGVGISGGEHGARHGPSIMPGGPFEAYMRVQKLFDAAAARFNGEPCVCYLGPGSAGHYVKMVHNGIEYGIMRLIAETYDIMKRGLDLAEDELAAVYEGWNEAELNGYLVEITAHIFRQIDPITRQRLINVILDEAQQEGTGMWTSEDALKLQVPVPSIDISVATRFMSAMKEERQSASRFYNAPPREFAGERYMFLEQLRNATYATMIIIYAQGMALLHRASHAYGYNLNLADVARVWRDGCIIRARVVEEIQTAFNARPDLPNLLLDPVLGAQVAARIEDTRSVIATAATLGIPVPALMVSLSYLEIYCSDWMPANLIQAQRDYFGAHRYARVDVPGTFHTEWEPE